MKPLPLTIVILLAAAVSWWIFGSDEPTPPSDVDAAIEQAKRTAATPSSELPDPPAGSLSKKAPSKAEVIEPAPAKKVYILPLADKFIESATWHDEDALVVLQHAAQAAGKVLRVDRSCRKRLEALRVNMQRGRTPVPKVLDLVLQPETMSWQVEREVLVVYDNDD